MSLYIVRVVNEIYTFIANFHEKVIVFGSNKIYGGCNI